MGDRKLVFQIYQERSNTISKLMELEIVKVKASFYIEE